MLVGVGADLVEVARITQLCQKDNRRQRLFTKEELAAAEKSGHEMETLAGYFAVKEAVGKALGTGLAGISWQDIQVVYQDTGKPKAVLVGAAAAKAKELQIKKLEISISHTAGLAMAFAVDEG